MDDLQIKVFQAVAHSGSFAGGAEELYLSRSSVKRQIDVLENELKVQLFDRTSQGVELTEAGKKFQEGIGPITESYEELVRQVRHTGDHRVIRIAYSPIVPIEGLSNAIQKYTLRHKNVSIELKPMSDSRQISAIRDGEADICVYYLTEEAMAADLELWRMPSFPRACCYIAPDDPLASRSIIEIDDLKGRRVSCRYGFLPGVVRALAERGIPCEDSHMDEQGYAEAIKFIQEGGIHIMTGGFAELLCCAEVPLDIEDIGSVGGVLSRKSPPDYLVEFIQLFDVLSPDSTSSAKKKKERGKEGS